MSAIFGTRTCLAAAALLLVLLTTPCFARTALVIGNGAYVAAAPLANAPNDASDMAEALRGAGFDVELILDGSRTDMNGAIARFAARLKGRGGAGLFYFAGHGVQFNGDNYLLPIDARVSSSEDIKTAGINASEAVEAMTRQRDGLNIVILDACRDNPFPAAGGTRGLSRIDSGANLFVSFSTSPGAVALDGSGRNSPYTGHLARAISTPGLTLEETFKRTLKGVHTETRGMQTPWLSSSFFGEFEFRPRKTASIAQPATASPLAAFEVDAEKRPSLAGVYRSTGTNPNGTTYTGMAAITPAGDQLRFTWWVGTEIYQGLGRWAGRMLVVELSETQKVVYTFPGGEKIEGEWADGKATDNLERAARAAARPLPAPRGTYNVVGKDRGKPYTGMLIISPAGTDLKFRWTISGKVFEGTGTRDGNVITVDWGSATPIVYALTDDGYMVGIYAGGHSLEVAQRR